jgi:hypothetical protein
MPSPRYQFTTHWRVPGTPEMVFDILDNPTDLSRWWPAVYLEVKQIEPGDAQGIGRVCELHTKGWLPYTLRWRFRTMEKQRPNRIVIEAQGDFNGRGIWTIKGDGPDVNVIFDWQIEAAKPLLRDLSWLLRPIFAANHRWAMARGEESLRLEVARRLAPTPAESASVPPPPGPSQVGAGTLLALGCGGLLIVIVGLYVLVRLLTGG